MHRKRYLQSLLENLVCLYDSLAEHFHPHNNEPMYKNVHSKIITNRNWKHISVIFFAFQNKK